MPSTHEKCTANWPDSIGRSKRTADTIAAPASTQIAICVSPTAPTPISLPASRSLGLAVASITSKMREVFS